MLVVRLSALGDAAILEPVLRQRAAANPDVLFLVAGPPRIEPLFRGMDNGLLENPYVVDVVSAAAPNRRGFDCLLSRRRRLDVITDRIRAVVFAAAAHDRRSLVLGAWGCGAFGNSPEDVSGCFRRVLVDEGLGASFDDVVFAIYGGESSRNLVAFQAAFPCARESQKGAGPT